MPNVIERNKIIMPPVPYYPEYAATNIEHYTVQPTEPGITVLFWYIKETVPSFKERKPYDAVASIVSKAVSRRYIDDNNARAALEARIESFRGFNDNWDGDNARAIKSECIDLIRKIIYDLPSDILHEININDLFPTPNGTISIEVGEGRQYFVLDVGISKVLYYYRFNNELAGLGEAEEFTDETVKAISSLYREFHQKIGKI
jgi:hypothetical protein